MNDAYTDTRDACRILNHMAESRKEECKKLRAELAKHQWISVKDRLPDEDVNVIIKFENCMTHESFVGVAWYDDGDWLWYLTAKILDKNISVTHWMPLPKKPEKPEKPEKPYEAWDRIAKEREQ